MPKNQIYLKSAIAIIFQLSNTKNTLNTAKY